tara:strand:+ start:2084 stop:2524 length:441 start_codon:yes stop_codon:yes gene_type:complete
MKITKEQLKQIIKEELTRVIQEGNDWWYHQSAKAAEPGGEHGGLTVEPSDSESSVTMGPPSPGVSIDSLWRDLNVLLENWPDHEHQYYQDLRNLMEDYSTGPDHPTRLPGAPEESDVEPLPTVTGASHRRNRRRARQGKHGIPPHE